MGDWKNLPHDVLLTVADYFDIHTDYIRFRSVCASWRSNLPKWPKHSCYNIPWLMLPNDDEDDDENNHQKLRALYNPLNVHEIYYLELSEIPYGNLRGSSNGWLVTLEDGFTLKLFNPLTNSQIQLPPIPSFPDIKQFDPNTRKYTIIDPNYSPYKLSQNYVHATYIKKIVCHDSMAIAIYGPYSKLAFSNFGDEKWTDIPTSLEFFHDCIFSDDKIYAVNQFGRLIVSPIDDPTQMADVLQLRQPKLEVGLFNLFLIKREDDLLLVERMNRGRKRIFEFNIYKLESEGWVEINNLDDYTIFVGRFNTSMCISSENCPELKGNEIYYTYDKKLPFFGIFDMKERSWRCLLQNEVSSSADWPHPIFVVPNPLLASF